MKGKDRTKDVMEDERLVIWNMMEKVKKKSLSLCVLGMFMIPSLYTLEEHQQMGGSEP